LTPGWKSLPEDLSDAGAFMSRMSDIYGDGEAAEIIAAMAQESDYTYWLNPLRTAEFKVVGQPVEGAPGMWQVPRASGFTNSEAAQLGRVYIQNPSSYLAVRLLDPQPGEEILDLAAAPGGKTIAIAAAMANTGRVAAVEPVKQRFHRMRANLERCGVTNVDFYQRDGRGVGRAVGERFDRVLLDAPCSSEARMRWNDPSTYAHWSLRKIKETQRKQKSLLRSAYASLKPGGVLVYSTCSYAPEENELVVQHLLRRTAAEIERLNSDLVPDHSIAGLNHWKGKDLRAELTATVRVLPRDAWDGFYLARISKPT
jgi:NOL1/NOP2/sun family putative RNA methylase